MDKKEILAKLMCGTGITGLARHWKNGRSTGLRVLAYHRVLDHLPPKDYKFDHELIQSALPSDDVCRAREQVEAG